MDFAEFYRRSRDDCLRTVLVSVGDQDTAQDLVDEAFARAWASWRTVSRHPAPTAWVVRTALNANISRWRRRRREVSVPDPGAVADLPAGDGADSPVDPRIMAALLRLPARQRQVVALRLFLDLDTGRTAEVLGIAPGTVKAHLARALAALRDDLMPEPTAGDPIMNDDELITAVREPVTDVHSTTPVEQILSRSRAIRARRRIPGLAAALAVAAGRGLAVTALLPASPATVQPGPAGRLDGGQAGRRQYPCHHPRAARSGRAAAHAPRRWRPGQRHLHRPVEPGMPALRPWRSVISCAAW